MEKHLQYGPVLIKRGPNKGRIGYYDDDEDDSGVSKIIIYPGVPIYCKRYYIVQRAYATSIIPTESIARRWEDIEHAICYERYKNELTAEEIIDLLHERIFCSDLLNERYFRSMESIEGQKNQCIFISHASKDLVFARCIATDLLNAGFAVFLDDWSIDVGDRIFDKISRGLVDSNALIMVISENYLKSACCNDEWSAFYNKALHVENCRIYPIIIDHSNPPMLLSQIKYLRINREDYSEGLSALLKSLKKQFTQNA